MSLSSMCKCSCFPGSSILKNTNFFFYRNAPVNEFVFSLINEAQWINGSEASQNFLLNGGFSLNSQMRSNTILYILKSV